MQFFTPTQTVEYPTAAYLETMNIRSTETDNASIPDGKSVSA